MTKNPRLVGLAVIAWAGGVPSILWDDAGLIDSVTDNGVGDVTLNLNTNHQFDGSGVAANDEMCMHINCRTATGAFASVIHTSDIAKRITVFAAAAGSPAVDDVPLEIAFFKRVRN